MCSCKANYIGSPPYCRPECVISQECPRDRACVNEKCVDPCIGACGANSKCDVVNHTPFCSCLAGYEGDAFISYAHLDNVEVTMFSSLVVDLAREHGAAAVEGYPVDTGGDRLDRLAVYCGTVEQFTDAGFEVVRPSAAVSGGRPRVVVRHLC